VTKKNWKFQHF